MHINKGFKRKSNMTFEAFSAHLTPIICPFRVSPSPPLFRFYFSSEICNPYCKELLTWWTFVVLVNAPIEARRLVKTCALAASLSGVCSEWGVQAQSFLLVCVQHGRHRVRGERVVQLDGGFPTSPWAPPQGLSVGRVGVTKRMEFCFPETQKLSLKNSLLKLMQPLAVHPLHRSQANP